MTAVISQPHTLFSTFIPKTPILSPQEWLNEPEANHFLVLGLKSGELYE